jgi:DNA polymerase III epsilon subunit-like protein
MPRDPKKINSYLVHDFETGGLPVDTSPIMSFAAVLVDGVTLDNVVKYDNLVKPYDEKLTYSPQAMAVNGLTVERCREEGVTLRQLVEDICALAEEANAGKGKGAKCILVGHNAGTFDGHFMTNIFDRCGVDMSKYFHGSKDSKGVFHPRIIDTIELNKAMIGHITDTDTNFKLQSCCIRAGIDLTNAHTALDDTIATADLLKYCLVRLRSGSSEVTMTEGKAAAHRQNFEWA